MGVTRTVLAPELPGVDALGVVDFDALFGARLGLDRQTVLAPGRGGCGRIRFALPGTPGDDGRLTGSPKGAGTGWVELWRWEAGGLKLGGEETWNLLCHLRAKGVATGMPLAVASKGWLRRRSLVVVRELTDHTPWLSAWTAASPGDRHLLERALGAFVGRLARAGVDASGFELADVVVAPEHEDHAHSEAGDEIDCAAKAIASLRETRAQHSWRKNRMPSLVLAEPGGVQLGEFDADRRLHVWERLIADLGPARSSRLELRLGSALSGERDRGPRQRFLRARVG